jgi:signal transduction histidine kinase/ActR/RegA family two-component response regulator/HAMP domain-containing protein
MSRFSSLRARLVGTVFLAVAPAWLLAYVIIKETGTEQDLPWTFLSGAIGLLALAAAWYGGEHFVLRQVRILYQAARRLAVGDLASRTGLQRERGELGELARTIDGMAASLEQRAHEREKSERTLMFRSLQQTVVSALGQFALMSNDFAALLSQAVILVAQTLEVEYCSLLELQAEHKLLLRTGVGWKPGTVGTVILPADQETQFGFTLTAGEPVVVERRPGEHTFKPSPLLTEHGVRSSMSVAVAGHGEAFGVLGAHTTHDRKFTEDEIHFLLAVATVLAMAAGRKRTEVQLEKLAAFAKLNPNPVMELSREGVPAYLNDAAGRLARSVGLDDPRGILPPNIAALVQTCLSSNSRLTLETEFNGRQLSWSFHPVPASQVVHAYVEDITDRLSLEAQLRQSQKMESVGQLAAGVAHDFNNMLTIIQGHSGMLLAKATEKPELVDSAQAIYFASERAANLTRQLLMFSRKNVMQPRPLDLREVVSHMSKMLRRLLGETITLQLRAPEALRAVQADLGMVEQVIMNLAVNARDAMPRGGTLTISTQAVEITDGYVHSHPEARPGSFVCLRVSDTGCGMDAQTMSRIFEPFFTTKEVGKGTGLGLATVYGIIKQHEGWLQTASEPGKGATFSVFFPVSELPATAPEMEAGPATAVRGGKETILVVEDEPVLRDMAHVILEDCGYRILEADSGRQALELWQRHRHEIDLVLTDMVMPEGISGMDLAQRLRAENPRLRLIFASGYSMDDLDTSFVRDGHAMFLQKPYTHVTLAKAVRDCLDNPPESQSML